MSGMTTRRLYKNPYFSLVSCWHYVNSRLQRNKYSWPSEQNMMLWVKAYKTMAFHSLEQHRTQCNENKLDMKMLPLNKMFVDFHLCCCHHLGLMWDILTFSHLSPSISNVYTQSLIQNSPSVFIHLTKINWWIYTPMLFVATRFLMKY